MAVGVRKTQIMLRKASLCLVLLGATTAMAATQNFLLGVGYSELIPTGALTYVTNTAAATDSSGAVYLLLSQNVSPNAAYLVKLTPAGDQVVYQTAIPFGALYLAVDPSGNAYLAGNYSADGSTFVEKLGTDGATMIYRTVVGRVNAIAVDGTGRAYAAGLGTNGQGGFVTRLKPDGTVDYSMNLAGAPAAIAVDSSGSAFVLGIASQGFTTTSGAYLDSGYFFLARLNVNGSGLTYSTYLPTTNAACCVAVDSADNAVVAFQSFSPMGSLIMRINSEGTAAGFSRIVPGQLPSGLAVDSAGNTYLTSSSFGANYPTKNSVAPCAPGGTSALTVFDPNGDVLQGTYVAGTSNPAIGANSTVYVAGAASAAYLPTRQVAGSAGGLAFFTQLSTNPNAQTVRLACEGNAASYDSAAIAGGEIVSLFGDGLGPATGTTPQVDVQTGFPKQLGSVQVTFNGTPGPLLYVQESQINAIAPWSLQAGQNVEICVVYNGAPTNCITRPAVDAHPGVFTVDGFYAAALNQDGTLNSAANPAKFGSVVTVFATGLGPISPPQPDGAIVGMPLPANVLPVTMDGEGFGIFGEITVPMAMQYAGPAPFEVAGVSQLNFVLNNGLLLFLYAGSGECNFAVYSQ